MFLTILGSVFGGIKWREKDLHKRNIMLDTMVKERTNELETKSYELEKKSNELKENFDELKQSTLHIKRLEGLLPICCNC